MNNTVIYARSTRSSSVGTGLARGKEVTGTIQLEEVPPGEIFLFVDTKLDSVVHSLTIGSSDCHRVYVVDNDGDGAIDQDDIGCSAPDDEDEADEDITSLC